MSRCNKVMWAVVAGLCAACGATDASLDLAQSDNSEGPVDSLGNALHPISAGLVRQALLDGNPTPAVRVELQPNYLFEIYELGGLIFYSGAGAPSDPEAVRFPDDLEARDVEGVWSFLSGGAPTPEALTRAIERARNRIATGDAPPAEATTPRPYTAEDEALHSDDDSEIGTLTQAFSGGSNDTSRNTGFCENGYETFTPPESWFDREYDLGDCPNMGEDVCWNNVTGTGSRSHSDIGLYVSNACPEKGNISVTQDADEDVGAEGTWTVPKDTARYFFFDGWPCDTIGNPFDDCPYINFRVHNASGDRYNARWHVYDP